MTISDKSGNVIATSVPPESRSFENMVIKNAWMVNLELERISFIGSDLTGSNLSGSDLYGSSLSETDMSDCNMQGVDLRNSYIDDVRFRNADLRNARCSLNELGGGLRFHAADFTGAKLEGADFTGAIYNEATIFPEGFNPKERGMIKLKDWEKEHLPRPD
jgi:uncharacterized protein YjbI with pentapeptide repeats